MPARRARPRPRRFPLTSLCSPARPMAAVLTSRSYQVSRRSGKETAKYAQAFRYRTAPTVYRPDGTTRFTLSAVLGYDAATSIPPYRSSPPILFCCCSQRMHASPQGASPHQHAAVPRSGVSAPRMRGPTLAAAVLRRRRFPVPRRATPRGRPLAVSLTPILAFPLSRRRRRLQCRPQFMAVMGHGAYPAVVTGNYPGGQGSNRTSQPGVTPPRLSFPAATAPCPCVHTRDRCYPTPMPPATGVTRRPVAYPAGGNRLPTLQ